MRRNIKDIDPAKWEGLFLSLGLKKFTARQVYQWLFQKGVSSFDEMTNLSKGARRLLSEKFDIGRPKLIQTLEDTDGTKKFLFELSDGERIESVLIPAYDGERITLCISSQVGCALGCVFCRTAGIGFRRHLTISEIVDQVLEVKRIDPRVITNIVFMGMGEPLNNYDNVTAAILILTNENGLSLAKRRITLSTAGIVPGIEKMAADKLGVKLAVSLNATTDTIRQKIMPIAKTYTIDDIVRACLKYAPFGSRWRTTFEYVLIGGVNDSREDAKRLVALMDRLPSKINLIPFNPFPESDCEKSQESTLTYFYNYLYDKGIQVNIRQSRGQDILAACGQLAAK